TREVTACWNRYTAADSPSRKLTATGPLVFAAAAASSTGWFHSGSPPWAIRTVPTVPAPACQASTEEGEARSVAAVTSDVAKCVMYFMGPRYRGRWKRGRGESCARG